MEAVGDKESVGSRHTAFEVVIVIIQLVVMGIDPEMISFQDKVGSWYSNPGNLERPVAGRGEVLAKCSSKRWQWVEHRLSSKDFSSW